jgi:hypothetical protein
MNKFTRRRRSTDYRTDLPIFRPSIADMVADARNRLLKFKEAQMQSHGRILTPATLAAMLLTDRQLKGAGQCVVSGTSVDPAIDAYTQFLHRYALHVSKPVSHAFDVGLALTNSSNATIGSAVPVGDGCGAAAHVSAARSGC